MLNLKNLLVRLPGPMRLAAAATLIFIPVALSASAQEPAQESDRSAATAPVVPQQVRYAGKLATRAGETVEAEFRIYAAAEGGEALWTETQQVPVSVDGSYAVLLGSSSATGLPQTVFAGGAARWLGVSVGGGAEAERVLLSSVPYAMKSADAESLAGHAASDFVTQAQLAALAARTAQTAAAVEAAQGSAQPDASHPLTNGALTGSGTSGTIPVWNGQYTEGNSNMVQVGNDIGINVSTPASALDVGGGATVRGTLDLPSTNTATTATGYSSEPLESSASAWSTTATAAVAENFALEATPVGNNTASPSGALALLYSSGTAALAPTGFSIGSNGLLTFAAGQTFPGVLTSATGVSPITATTSSGAVTVGLNTAALETTLNKVYPQLTVANTFTSSQTIDNGLTVTGPITGSSETLTGTLTSESGVVSNGAINIKTILAATPTTKYNSPLFQFGSSVYNSTLSAAQLQNFGLGVFGTGNDTATPSAYLAVLFGQGTGALSQTGLTIGSNGVITFAPAQTFPIKGTGGGTITGITTASPLTGSGTSGSVALGLNQSALVTDIAPAMATAITPTLENTLNGVYAQLETNNVFQGYLDASSGGGPDYAAVLGFGTNATIGTYGNSDTGFGVNGVSATPTEKHSGVLGNTGGVNVFSNTRTNLGSTAHEVAGVWGDTTGNPNSGGGNIWAAGVLGTADNADGGAFFNTSNDFYTLWAQALGASGAIGGSATSGDGVDGYSGSGIGVFGASTSSSGVYGSSTTDYGVAGYSGTGDGVYGDAEGTGSGGSSFTGVSGYTVAPTPGNAGTFGYAYELSEIYSFVTQFDFSSGVWGDAGNPNDGAGNNAAGMIGTADSETAGLFLNNSADNETISAANYNTSGTTGLFRVFKASTPKGVCGIGDGDLSCTGQVKSLVSTSGGARTVETYATQSAENWMEDYGTGVMQMGVAVVKIDPAFAETISATPDYHVFITPNGDAEALYVINKTGASFEVRESKGGTSSMTFDYKIVARRRGYEKQRLVDVTERFNVEQARSLIGRAHGVPIPAAGRARPHMAPSTIRPIGNGNGAKASVTASPAPPAKRIPGRVSGTNP